MIHAPDQHTNKKAKKKKKKKKKRKQSIHLKPYQIRSEENEKMKKKHG